MLKQMLDKMKAWLQVKALDEVKKYLITQINLLIEKVSEGYIITQNDLDHILVGLKFGALEAAIVSQFVVGLNLRDVVGSSNTAAVKFLLQSAILKINGWRL